MSLDTIVEQTTVRAEDHQLMRAGFVGQVVKDGGDMAFEIIAETSGEENIPEPSADCML